jgi:hypothetical protein
LLYYVKTGDIDTSLRASSHFHAAKKAVSNGGDYGICVVVSEKQISEDSEDNVYFFTENLFPSPEMRVVT